MPPGVVLYSSLLALASLPSVFLYPCAETERERGSYGDSGGVTVPNHRRGDAEKPIAFRDFKQQSAIRKH